MPVIFKIANMSSLGIICPDCLEFRQPWNKKQRQVERLWCFLRLGRVHPCGVVQRGPRRRMSWWEAGEHQGMLQQPDYRRDVLLSVVNSGLELGAYFFVGLKIYFNALVCNQSKSIVAIINHYRKTICFSSRDGPCVVNIFFSTSTTYVSRFCVTWCPLWQVWPEYLGNWGLA